jgi:hypothetical protein
MVANDGIIYVSSTNKNCIFSIARNDSVTLFAGPKAGMSGFANGNQLNATFFEPRGY